MFKITKIRLGDKVIRILIAYTGVVLTWIIDDYLGVILRIENILNWVLKKRILSCGLNVIEIYFSLVTTLYVM